jgi:hypothetical protein
MVRAAAWCAQYGLRPVQPSIGACLHEEGYLGQYCPKQALAFGVCSLPSYCLCLCDSQDSTPSLPLAHLIAACMPTRQGCCLQTASPSTATGAGTLHRMRRPPPPPDAPAASRRPAPALLSTQHSHPPAPFQLDGTCHLSTPSRRAWPGPQDMGSRWGRWAQPGWAGAEVGWTCGRPYGSRAGALLLHAVPERQQRSRRHR